MTTAVAVVSEVTDDVGLMPAWSQPEFGRALSTFVAFVRQQLVEGINDDYGTIPGTRKPTLFQPGAQKIASYFGLTPIPHLEREIMTPDFASKTYRIDLLDRRTGKVVAACARSCNSAEKRFYTKQGAPLFSDARSCENDIDGMSQKRALVGAVLIAVRASGIFTQDVVTQDVEDLPREQLAPQQERSVESKEPITLDTKVAFGKAKGTAIRDLPDSYLHWATDGQQKNFGSRTDEWIGAFETEIERRSNVSA